MDIHFFFAMKGRHGAAAQVLHYWWQAASHAVTCRVSTLIHMTVSCLSVCRPPPRAQPSWAHAVPAVPAAPCKPYIPGGKRAVSQPPASCTSETHQMNRPMPLNCSIQIQYVMPVTYTARSISVHVFCLPLTETGKGRICPVMSDRFSSVHYQWSISMLLSTTDQISVISQIRDLPVLSLVLGRKLLVFTSTDQETVEWYAPLVSVSPINHGRFNILKCCEAQTLATGNILKPGVGFLWCFNFPSGKHHLLVVSPSLCGLLGNRDQCCGGRRYCKQRQLHPAW